MDEAQIQEWVDQLTGALRRLQPLPQQQQPPPPEPGTWEFFLSTLSFAPMATLVIGLAAAIIAVGTLIQRRRSDARAEWWRRAEWALDARIHTNSEMNRNGKSMLAALLSSKLAGKEERKFIREVTTPPPVADDPVSPEAQAFADAIKADNPEMSDEDTLLLGRRAAAYYAESGNSGVDDRDNDSDNGDETEEARSEDAK